MGADAIEDGRGRGTITDDDSGGGDRPSLSIDDVTGMEGDSGTTDFVFTVTRSGDTSDASTVHYRTRDGTAGTPQDYRRITDAVLDFAPGQTTGEIIVKVKGDGKRALDETFFVILGEPVRATIADRRGRGTILLDDPFLAIRDVTIDEPADGTRIARFRVVLSFPTTSDVTSTTAPATARRWPVGTTWPRPTASSPSLLASGSGTPRSRSMPTAAASPTSASSSTCSMPPGPVRCHRPRWHPAYRGRHGQGAHPRLTERDVAERRRSHRSRGPGPHDPGLVSCWLVSTGPRILIHAPLD